MNIKNIKIKLLITNIIISLIYPIYKLIKLKNLVAFSDACLMTCLPYIIIGIVTSLINHGDYDIPTYIAEKKFKKTNVDLDTYLKTKKNKRKDNFNYSFLMAIILFILSFISTLF